MAQEVNLYVTVSSSGYQVLDSWIILKTERIRMLHGASCSIEIKACIRLMFSQQITAKTRSNS